MFPGGGYWIGPDVALRVDSMIGFIGVGPGFRALELDRVCWCHLLYLECLFSLH